MTLRADMVKADLRRRVYALLGAGYSPREAARLTGTPLAEAEAWAQERARLLAAVTP